VRVNPGANVQKQDLPYDPGGVVYDSVSGTPVPGAVVRLVGPPGFDPAQHLFDGRDSYTTGPGGYYDFFVLPGAPAGEYRLASRRRAPTCRRRSTRPRPARWARSRARHLPTDRHPRRPTPAW
jgi:hypothetical protein